VRGFTLLLLTRLLWPRLTAAPPLPTHLLPPFAALRWSSVGAKVVAIPLIVGASAAAMDPLRVTALLVTAVALGFASRRSEHVGAGHLVQDAVFLCVSALCLAGVDGAPVLAGGAGVALVALSIGAGVLWSRWGRAPRPVWMRRHDFRVLGDNPDALTAVARLRIAENLGWRLHLRDLGDGPVTVALLDPRMRPVAHLGWASIEPALRRDGHLAVGLGLGAGDADLDAPPGRYWLSVRYYAPRRRDAAPPTLVRSPR